jgi:uncharacterized membrane protein YeiH
MTASTVSLCEFYFFIRIGKRVFYFFRSIGKRFFAASGVQLALSKQFHYRRAAFSSQLKAKVGNILAKVAALRINLHIHVAPYSF